MAEKLDPRQIATLEELLMTVLYEQKPLRRVLVRKGVLTNEEVLEEVKRIVIVLIPFSYMEANRGDELTHGSHSQIGPSGCTRRY